MHERRDRQRDRALHVHERPGGGLHRLQLCRPRGLQRRFLLRAAVALEADVPDDDGFEPARGHPCGRILRQARVRRAPLERERARAVGVVRAPVDAEDHRVVGPRVALLMPERAVAIAILHGMRSRPQAPAQVVGRAVQALGVHARARVRRVDLVPARHARRSDDRPPPASISPGGHGTVWCARPRLGELTGCHLPDTGTRRRPSR